MHPLSIFQNLPNAQTQGTNPNVNFGLCLIMIWYWLIMETNAPHKCKITCTDVRCVQEDIWELFVVYV